MLTTQVYIPQSAAELAELQAKELARNEELTRKRVAEENRKRQKAEPKPGSKLYVTTARGIPTRGRAGLLFSPNPAEVTVSDEADDEIAKKVQGGAYVVSVWGAEQILADSYPDIGGLVVFTNRTDAGTPTLANESTEALEAELARRKAAPAMQGEERITSKRGHKSGE